MTSDPSRIGFIGAGRMGMPMVRRLIAAGHDLTVFGRRPEVRGECEGAGAAITDDVRVAVHDADSVVVCLYADDHVRAAALGPDGFLGAMKPGATLIVHTTGSPATTRMLSALGAARELRVVEAPVSGTAQDIADGRITVLLSGDPAHLDAARAVVEAYGSPILIVGPLGGAPVVKLVNNALFAAQLQLAGEVERIAASVGVDMATAAAVIQQSSGSSYAMGVVERWGSLAQVADAAGHFLAKDLAAAEQVADELGIDLGLIGRTNREGPVTFAGRADDPAD